MGNLMRSRLLSASATLTVVLLGVSVGPSSAQTSATPPTLFVGVVTVTSPPAVPVRPTLNPQATGTRRTVSCSSSNRGHGKGRHVKKRLCRKRSVWVAATRRTVQTVSTPQATFVVPPPLTFTVAPPPPAPVLSPPPVFVVAAPPPVFVVNVAIAPVATRAERSDDGDRESRKRERDTKKKVKREAKENDRSNAKGRGGEDDDDD